MVREAEQSYTDSTELHAILERLQGSTVCKRSAGKAIAAEWLAVGDVHAPALRLSVGINTLTFLNGRALCLKCFGPLAYLAIMARSMSTQFSALWLISFIRSKKWSS